MAIPSDADDTACALAALGRFSPEKIHPHDVELLRGYWRRPEGPFRTWNSLELPWNRLDRDDVVVNCNVAYALRCMGCTLTGSESRCLNALLNATRHRSRYYCSVLTVGYTARRAGFDPFLCEAVRRTEPSGALDPLEMAQYLLVAGRQDSPLLETLLDLQEPDGAWAAAPWCDGEGLRPWGSPAITTALCLEALQELAQRPGASERWD